MSTARPLTVTETLALRGAHLVTGLFLFLGLLGALRTGLDEPRRLIVFEITPSLSILWLAIGLVGAGMATGADRARLYLTLSAMVLLAWTATTSFAGTADGLFVDDRAVVLFSAAVGLSSLVVAVAAALRRPTISSDGAPERTP